MENKETKKDIKLDKIKEIKKVKTKRKIIISTISVIVVIIIALIIISALDVTQKTFGGKIAAIFSIEKEITEEKAIKEALNRFDEMGEENLTEDNLEVIKILRKGEYYYYISSPDNSLEIRISDGKVVRENSVLVDE